MKTVNIGVSMACFQPLKAIEIPGTTKNGKTRYKVLPRHVNPENYIEVPCGKCIGCRLDYSRRWADRCMCEASMHEQSWFVTLTYDDVHLPYSEQVIDLGTGELIYPTLVKRDMQLFMKRLRKNYKYDNKIRFYLCGEYGKKKARPHYHPILFGLKLDDLKFHKKTAQGFNLYTSKFLESVWPYGIVIVAEVSWETCAYVARYILKKQNGDNAEFFKENGIQQEFTLMSRKPGIGREYYDMHKEEFLKYGESHIATIKGGKKIHTNKYFDKLLDVEYPTDREEYKTKLKEIMEIRKAKKLERTSKQYEDMLETEEAIKLIRIQKLPRKEM